LIGTIVVLANGVTGCSGVCALLIRRHGVEHYVTQVAGGAAVDCGTIRHGLVEWTLTPEEEEQISTCATAAHAEGRPFYFYEWGPGTDSHLAKGHVGTGDGELVGFSYDSAPCGGDCCSERFTIRPCLPIPAGATIGPYVQCVEARDDQPHN
jgi:hypothetical protein